MTIGGEKDQIDNFLEFILNDDSPMAPEDMVLVEMFDRTISEAESQLTRARFERAKAGALAAYSKPDGNVVNLERARALLQRAKDGDTSAQVTLAARFGDGFMDGDMDAIAEDLAELLDDDDQEN